MEKLKTQGKNSRFGQIHLVELPKTGPISKPAVYEHVLMLRRNPILSEFGIHIRLESCILLHLMVRDCSNSGPGKQ